MKRALLILGFSMLIVTCDQPEPGAVDNESLSRKLFDVVRDNNFEKSEILIPDKGTYRKIMKESKGEDISEDAFDQMMTRANANFDSVRNMLPNWPETKFENAQTEFTKQGSMQFATTVVKFEANGDHHKFRYTSCKYNSKWFYLGDMQWVAK